MDVTAEIKLTRVSTKGQVVIPKSARARLNWQPGDHLTVEVHGNAVVLRKVSLDAILREAEEEWQRGETVTLWPKKE
jgi:AbrB family looped-hinge helix DNA binding protein